MSRQLAEAREKYDSRVITVNAADYDWSPAKTQDYLVLEVVEISKTWLIFRGQRLTTRGAIFKADLGQAPTKGIQNARFISVRDEI